MDRSERAAAGAAAGQLTPEAFLLRAALLAGRAADSRPLARAIARAVDSSSGRSCLEAGAPLQVTVDAPGTAQLRIGLQLGRRFVAARLEGLAPRVELEQFERAVAALPAADHPSVGMWLFWSADRRSLFVDLRDPDPSAALARLHRIAGPEQLRRLQDWRQRLPEVRPWAIQIDQGQPTGPVLRMHWLLERHAAPGPTADAIAPGHWERAVEAFGRVLRRPGASGRFVFGTPLDAHSDEGLQVASSGWVFRPEDAAKHRAVGELMSAYGGPRDYAQALWSLCRGSVGSSWRVGRAIEIAIRADVIRTRLFLVPEVQAVGNTAGTRTSADEDS